MVCLHGKVIVIIASDVFVAVAMNIHNKVQELSFSSISFTVSRAQFKEAGY